MLENIIKNHIASESYSIKKKNNLIINRNAIKLSITLASEDYINAYFENKHLNIKLKVAKLVSSGESESSILKKLKAGAKNVWDFIVKVFTTIINTLSNWWNGFINFFKKFFNKNKADQDDLNQMVKDKNLKLNAPAGEIPQLLLEYKNSRREKVKKRKIVQPTNKEPIITESRSAFLMVSDLNVFKNRIDSIHSVEKEILDISKEMSRIFEYTLNKEDRELVNTSIYGNQFKKWNTKISNDIDKISTLNKDELQKIRLLTLKDIQEYMTKRENIIKEVENSKSIADEALKEMKAIVYILKKQTNEQNIPSFLRLAQNSSLLLNKAVVAANASKQKILGQIAKENKIIFI